MAYESSQSTVHPPAHQDRDRDRDVEGEKKEACVNIAFLSSNSYELELLTQLFVHLCMWQ